MSIKNFHIVLLCFLLMGQHLYAQEKDKQRALQETLNQDDLGDVSDKFQEHFFKALAQKAIENYEKAIAELEKCKALRPKEASVYFELGKNFLKLEKYPQAEQSLKKALEIKPESEPVLNRLFTVYFQSREFPKAIGTARKLTAFNANYYEDLANLYIETQQYQKALEALDAIDQLRGQSSYREKLRRQVFETTGDRSRQIAYLKKKINEHPDHMENYINLMYVYNQTGQFKEANQAAENFTKKFPKAEEAALGQYKFYVQQEKYDEAVNAMKDILDSSVDNAIKKTVIDDFTALVKEHKNYEPDLVEVLNQQGDASDKSNRQLGDYYQQRDKAKALDYYEKALKENPNDFQLIKKTLLLQIDEHKYQRALDLSSKTMAYFPAQPLIYLIQGVAHNGLGESHSAISSLETGLGFLVDDPQMRKDFYEQLKLSYEEIGNLQKSEEFSEKIKKIK